MQKTMKHNFKKKISKKKKKLENGLGKMHLKNIYEKGKEKGT